MSLSPIKFEIHQPRIKIFYVEDAPVVEGESFVFISGHIAAVTGPINSLVPVTMPEKRLKSHSVLPF
jgi:hypothetical protein